VLGPERRALTLGILLAIGAFAVEGMGVVPALPTAVRELHGLPLFGWAFSALMLAWLIGTVGGGLVADARGPRLPMALGLFGFGAGLVLAATAHHMAQFLGGRALQGSGGGAMLASAYVAITRGYPDSLRPRMMAITASVWILPAVLGPAASGAITERVGWRWVFAGILPVLAVAALVVLPPLGRFDVRREWAGVGRLYSVLRVAVGSGLVLAAPSLHLAWGAASVVAGLLLAGPGLRALLPPGTATARPVLPAGLAVRALLAFSFYGTESFVPLGASELRGATPTAAGLALTTAALGWISTSWAQDRLEARGGPGGRVERVRGGFLLLALGIAAAAVGLVTTLPWWLVPLGWAVGGAGMGFAFSAGGLICIAEAPPEKEGEVSGQLQLAEALSTAAGAGFGGGLLTLLALAGLAPRLSHAAVFALTFVAALGGAAISGRLRLSK
jgi:MFS family permease